VGVKNEEEKFGSMGRQSNNDNDDDSGSGRGNARVPNYYIGAADRLFFNLVEIFRREPDPSIAREFSGHAVVQPPDRSDEQQRETTSVNQKALSTEVNVTPIASKKPASSSPEKKTAISHSATKPKNNADNHYQDNHCNFLHLVHSCYSSTLIHHQFLQVQHPMNISYPPSYHPLQSAQGFLHEVRPCKLAKRLIGR
jgi:hypothetical protein